MNSNRVPMKVQRYVRLTAQHEHRGWRRPFVKDFTPTFLIKYVGREGYFTYGYLTSEAAEAVIVNMQREGTDTEQFYAFNVQRDPERVVIR